MGTGAGGYYNLAAEAGGLRISYVVRCSSCPSSSWMATAGQPHRVPGADGTHPAGGAKKAAAACPCHPRKDLEAPMRLHLKSSRARGLPPMRLRIPLSQRLLLPPPFPSDLQQQLDREGRSVVPVVVHLCYTMAKQRERGETYVCRKSSWAAAEKQRKSSAASVPTSPFLPIMEAAPISSAMLEMRSSTVVGQRQEPSRCSSTETSGKTVPSSGER